MTARLLPRSLLGQMLLSVALALLVAQGISGTLLYRSTEQRREAGAANGLAYQLMSDSRFDLKTAGRSSRGGNMPPWQRLRMETTTNNPLASGESRNARREEQVRAILAEQGLVPAELVVTTRKVAQDAYVMGRLQNGDAGKRWQRQWVDGSLIVAALRRQGESEWTVARVPLSRADPRQLWILITQTVLLYLLLVGGLAILLRRITRPLAALTRRAQTIGTSQTPLPPLTPSGPDDARRLITAHNAMEARIAALLDEKNVMLGAIGHDLKTPLAALRVRIEIVEDDAERAKLAAVIEDITRTLDDILSLARVGRPSDPLERTDLSALVASVVEEYEDMGDPVTLGETQRLPLALRATWLRRALRNLIGNALRYGERAHVTLTQEGNEAVIRIEDEGPGIAEQDIAAMLEPFARGESSRNRHTGGAGLGLTLARAIADQHGGRLVLANRQDRSGPTRGLAAELRLPLK